MSTDAARKERSPAQRAAAHTLQGMSSAMSADLPDKVNSRSTTWHNQRLCILRATKLPLRLGGNATEEWWQDVQQAACHFALLRAARPLSDPRLEQKLLASGRRLRDDLKKFLEMTAYGEFSGTPIHTSLTAVEALIKQLPAACDVVSSLVDHLTPQALPEPPAAPSPKPTEGEPECPRLPRTGRPPDLALWYFAHDMERLYEKGFGKPPPMRAENSTFVRFAVACANAARATLTKVAFREHLRVHEAIGRRHKEGGNGRK